MTEVAPPFRSRCRLVPRATAFSSLQTCWWLLPLSRCWFAEALMRTFVLCGASERLVDVLPQPVGWMRTPQCRCRCSHPLCCLAAGGGCWCPLECAFEPSRHARVALSARLRFTARWSARSERARQLVASRGAYPGEEVFGFQPAPYATGADDSRCTLDATIEWLAWLGQSGAATVCRVDFPPAGEWLVDGLEPVTCWRGRS
jgi:hypothetical protein